MAEAIRNLQIFRNGAPLTVTSRDDAKAAIEQAIESKQITLHDGEPISIRYQYEEDKKDSIVRGLFGVASVYDGKTQILWSPSTDDIVINLVDGNYTTGSSTIDDSGIQLSVDAKVTDIDEAGKLIGYKKINSENPEDNISEADYDDLDDTEKENYEPIYENGLVTALNVKEFVESAINEINVPEYTISTVDGETNKWQLKKDGEVVVGSTIEVTIPEAETYTIAKLETAEDGYLATYELQDSEGNTVGASINIPKDFLVKSGEVKTVVTEELPYTGAKVGDKYIDFVINTKEGTSTEEHIYLPVNDLVDAYTEGNGIDISEANEISIKVKSGEEYIEVTEDGIATTEALTSKIIEEAENAANAAVQGLGSKTASDGKYISGIKVNEDGEFEITEEALPEGDIYYGGKDVVVKKETRGEDTEAKNYIDTALDAEIVSDINLGGLLQGDKLTEGMSLSDILYKILSKEYDVTKTAPTSALSVPGVDSTYEVGQSLGTVTMSHTYTDGSFGPATGYTDAKFIEKNGSKPLSAGCAEGNTTYKYDNVTKATTSGSYEYTVPTLTAGPHTFSCQTAYGANTNTPKTSFGNDSTVKISAGNTSVSSKTINVYYKGYIKENVALSDMPSDFRTLMVSANEFYITSNTCKSNEEFAVEGDTRRTIFIFPAAKNFTIKNSLGSPATSEFVKQDVTLTNTYGTTYYVYIKSNNSGSTAKYKELTFANA